MVIASRSILAAAAWLFVHHAACAESLSAKAAGARYGQALGAVEICIGAKLTNQAQALKAAHAGDDLRAFELEAAKVFDSWRRVKACVRPGDPNECKIIMDRSCQAAVDEIGREGSAVRGLIEFAAP